LLYVIKVINQNEKELLFFKEDIPSVADAERILVDAISGDLKQLREELENVKATALKDGDIKREKAGGKLQRKLTLEELSEHRSYTRTVQGVTHYNRMDSENDFTAMERFAKAAEYEIEEASSLERKMKETYANILKYFGEDESLSSTDFFGTITKFLAAFDAALDQFNKMEEVRVRFHTIGLLHLLMAILLSAILDQGREEACGTNGKREKESL